MLNAKWKQRLKQITRAKLSTKSSGSQAYPKADQEFHKKELTLSNLNQLSMQRSRKDEREQKLTKHAKD